jgi:archaellum component FlaF (FlaF/FlaG flagellin family)
MGFAIPAAGAILFTAVAIAGTSVTAELLESMSTAGAAEREAVDRASDVANTRITVTSTQRTGNTVTVLSTNSGTVTLDASQVQVLGDGVYKTVTSRKVGNSASNTVWAPGTVLELKWTQTSTPAGVHVIAENGAVGHWGT